MSLEREYKKSLEKQWCLRFKTRHPDRDNYDGVITQIEREFIVLRAEDDFVFDGTMIFPKNSIKGCRDGKFERCFNEIIRQNGQIKKCRSPRWLNTCKTLPDILKQMMQRDIWPAVEILFSKKKEDALFIGPITSIADDHFFIKAYDATGRWEKKYKLTYKEIFRIEFNSNYCNNFNAYMREKSKT